MYMVISIRNVGTGLAVMHGWHVEVTGQPQQTHPPLEEFIAQTRDIYVAPGDIGFWQGALRDPATAQFKAAAAAVEAGDPMMLSILYGDWEGRPASDQPVRAAARERQVADVNGQALQRRPP